MQRMQKSTNEPGSQQGYLLSWLSQFSLLSRLCTIIRTCFIRSRLNLKYFDSLSWKSLLPCGFPKAVCLDIQKKRIIVQSKIIGFLDDFHHHSMLSLGGWYAYHFHHYIQHYEHMSIYTGLIILTFHSNDQSFQFQWNYFHAV